ncbi:endonuclease/exonuclease/phosphatase family protein [Fulvimonas sp. R45]|jgi:endonuclease/exonuclease/phosphatase family metal-dependent hydrolase|uniref:endonuclease/exonuclease/phosphatase family protein n=1 Tax=Fulvimonas sp. R45 TaxID=3045937 RepID=UPI00265DCAE5|nr:endonuclease/exonuclease/phosphatase family protein [Fulvimonas sp. R45]MDO1528383.1 endonuclease/exonuclease/phosphatase family protein [Fulvimonas sp. R45]
MRRLHRWATALLAMTCLAAPLAAQTLRVMSFNVRTLAAKDGPNRWELRRDLMVRTIREQHPDVMGTQELYKQQGDYLVSKLPGYTWFGEGRYGGDGDEHMGVFYRRDRLRVLASGNFWLSDTPDVPGSISWGHPMPRMVTWAKFEDRRNGRIFYYYNTHFPYREQDVEARNRCAAEIAARIAKLPAGTPVVLTGDFNTDPSSQVYAMLTKALQDARAAVAHPTGPEKTFHDFTGVPDQRIDWILERGFKPLSYATVTTHEGKRYPSDHFPVFTELQWKPARH